MRPISTFLYILCFVCVCQPLVAQQKLIALHHAGTASFFSTLQSAHDAAVNGDTLYIPGGNFEGIVLQKSLALIGVGHHPDSTSATGRTVLPTLSIYAGASHSFITGIVFTGIIYSQDTVSDLVISRCYLNHGIALFTGNGAKTNWIISENWIGSGSYFNNGYSIQWYANPGSAPSNFILSNNVILSIVQTLVSSEISNNIFLSNVLQASNSVIRNNIFPGNYEGSTNNCQWLNNLNSGVNGITSQNSGTGNYLDNLSLITAFVNYSPGNTFHQNDFHVVNPAYLGSDGMPVGIYGGTFPWKAGSLPFNPHVRSKSIGSTTNPDGTLHINVVVKAQGN